MLSDKEIEIAKSGTKYSSKPPLHQHNDCIRIAYEWLDAQAKIGSPTKAANPLKHLIERWAGRYVSTNDVEVAACLHPDISGNYPHYNISARLTEPSTDRLSNISESGKQASYNESHDPTAYQTKESIS